MWQLSNEVLASAESKYNLCTKSLLHNLIKSRNIRSASSSSLDQQSNSSSLESIESFALDCNQALSTSCSEDSFEMSSIISRPTIENPSQLSLQSLNLTSSFLGRENSVQPTNISSNCQERKFSEFNSSSQMSQDSLEPYSSWEKSNSLNNIVISKKKNPLILTSYHFDCSDKSNDFREISRDEVTTNGTVNGNVVRTAKSWAICHGLPNTWKSKDSIKRDKASLREYIDKELDNLDTCLPQLDFNKLEEKLNCAAKERIVTERKLLGEQVNFSFLL